MERKIESKNVATRRVIYNNYREHHAGILPLLTSLNLQG
jgi:hypothetical protein